MSDTATVDLAPPTDCHGSSGRSGPPPPSGRRTLNAEFPNGPKFGPFGFVRCTRPQPTRRDGGIAARSLGRLAIDVGMVLLAGLIVFAYKHPSRREQSDHL